MAKSLVYGGAKGPGCDSEQIFSNQIISIEMVKFPNSKFFFINNIFFLFGNSHKTNMQMRNKEHEQRVGTILIHNVIKKI